MVAALAVGVIALAIGLMGTVSGGQIGVALNIILVVNTTLMRVVECYTDLELSLGAIARLKNLEATVSSEDASDDGHQSLETTIYWPKPGAVEMNNVTAAYGLVVIPWCL